MATIRITSIAASGPSLCNNTTFPFLPRYSRNKKVFQKIKQKRSLNVGPRCSKNPPPGESNSRAVLDAFFIGKAFAEALNERIGTAVGEFLSEVGRLQAEQQKQIRDFQEEVLKRAKIVREKAAHEAQGKEQVKDSSSSSYINSTSVSTDSSSVSNNSSSLVVPNSTSSNSGMLQTESNEN